MIIDATIVRAHQHSASAQKKTARKPSVDPRRIDRQNSRTRQCPRQSCRGDAPPGQDHDLTCAKPLIEAVDPGALIADALNARSITPVVPPKSNRTTPRPCDYALYCERNLIEPFFNKLKHFRAIATRYDKLAKIFIAGVQLALHYHPP
jgi:transposase